MTPSPGWRHGAGLLRMVVGVMVGLGALAVVVVPNEVASAATDVVTNCNGSSAVAGSLPYEAANAAPGDTITFALSPSCATIDLAATIDISADLTIAGPGAGALTVNGAGSASVFSVGSATATISGLSIENGGGSDGGGIFNSGTLTIDSSTVSDNSAEIAGGIFNSGTLTIDSSTVSGNTGTEDAGGIYNSGTLTIDSSTVSGNKSAYSGGGIESVFATLTVSNSTVSDNTASEFGGGIYVYDDYDPSQPVAATITNSTLSDDTGSYGGGISSDQGPVALGASIIANSPSGNDCYFELAPLTDLGYNLDDDGSCGLAGTGDLSDTPAGLDPAGLQDNGGGTETIALETGSAAIDQVSDAGLCPDTDQRGVTRTVPCDIGAYDTDVAVVVPCAPGTTGCSATVTAPSQIVDVTGVKLPTTTATISLSVTTEVLSCVNFAYSAPVAVLTDSGLTKGSTVVVTDKVNGLPSAKGVVICYQPSGSPAPAPYFLKKCHGKKPVACYKSISERDGTVVAELQVPAGDPKFHVGAETPEVTGLSPALAAPGKKLTVKGINLSEITSVTIGGVAARITKTAPTKVIVTVPAGAKTGIIRVASLAGVATSTTVFKVT